MYTKTRKLQHKEDLSIFNEKARLSEEQVDAYLGLLEAVAGGARLGEPLAPSQVDEIQRPVQRLRKELAFGDYNVGSGY